MTIIIRNDKQILHSIHNSVGLLQFGHYYRIVTVDAMNEFTFTSHYLEATKSHVEVELK